MYHNPNKDPFKGTCNSTYYLLAKTPDPPSREPTQISNHVRHGRGLGSCGGVAGFLDDVHALLHLDDLSMDVGVAT